MSAPRFLPLQIRRIRAIPCPCDYAGSTCSARPPLCFLHAYLAFAAEYLRHARNGPLETFGWAMTQEATALVMVLVRCSLSPRMSSCDTARQMIYAIAAELADRVGGTDTSSLDALLRCVDPTAPCEDE